jgi:hypothetical protein
MNHFTNDDGYKAISSQPTWTFKASQPPGDHPFGAYFTTLDEKERGLAARLRIPREKLAYIFSFSPKGGLQPLPGGRGQYIFYSPTDYSVPPELQDRHGPTEL